MRVAMFFFFFCEERLIIQLKIFFYSYNSAIAKEILMKLHQKNNLQNYMFSL